LPPHEYLIHVSPESRRPRGFLWPIRLDERLPVVSIPLRKGDVDVQLDVQAVFATVYDRAGYQYQIDYKVSPEAPLDEARSAWADALLRSKGLRS
jgi:hypothetical protein